MAVILLCLNEEESLLSTCRSLGFGTSGVNQTPQAVLVIVDNGSTDNTISVAREIQDASLPGTVIIGREELLRTQAAAIALVGLQRRDPEADVQIVYYRGERDASTIRGALEPLGYRIREKRAEADVDSVPINTIRYGSEVPALAVQDVAISLMAAGLPLKRIAASTSADELSRITVYGVPKLQDSRALTIADVQTISSASPNAPPSNPVSAPPTTPRRVTLQYQARADAATVSTLREALSRGRGWRVDDPEHVLPGGANTPEVYGGVRYFFDEDAVLARTVCEAVRSELARNGYSVTIPIWPMVTLTEQGHFGASPGLVEVWISPLPQRTSGGDAAQMGRCGR